MPPAPVPRVTLIADTAISLLAERGMRGLTHRAVDTAAGLPPGSTSYHARTRAALLDIAMGRMTELEVAALPSGLETGPATDVADSAEALARFLYQATTEDRTRTLARFEFALEATRRPELRAIYDEAGRRFREPAAALLARCGSSHPHRHARSLIAWCDGIVFDSVAGAGWQRPPSHDELRDGLLELLASMLADRSG